MSYIFLCLVFCTDNHISLGVRIPLHTFDNYCNNRIATISNYMFEGLPM